MGERPEEVPADDEAEAAGLEGKLLRIRFYEADGQSPHLAPCLGQHGGREVDPCYAIPTCRELQSEEASSTARVERMQRPSPSEDEIENAIPGGALGRRANTVAEVLIEVGCPAVPMGRDPLLAVVSSFGGHTLLPHVDSMTWSAGLCPLEDLVSVGEQRLDAVAN